MKNNKNDQKSGLGFEVPDLDDVKRNGLGKDHTRSRPDLPSTNMHSINQPIQREQEELGDISRQNSKIDRHYNNEVDRSWSLGEKISQWSLYKQVTRERKKLLKQSAETRLQGYSTMLEARLEALAEKCNAGVKMFKGHYRKQVSSFLMSKIDALSEEIKDKQVRFVERMTEKYDHCRTLDDYPSLQKNFRETIFQEEKRYLQFLDKLLLKFEAIVDEELSKYK